MKKMISLCAVLLCMGIASAQTNFYQNSSYISDSGAKPEVKTVLNYDKNLIMGYTITFNYDAKDIETAVLPLPTSPCKRRFIGAPFFISLRASLTAFLCAAVGLKGKAE